jgi:hypothetical protein
MRSRRRELADRRLALVRRSGAQRSELAAAVAPFHRPLALADSVVGIVRRVRRYRALFSVAAAVLVAVGPLRAHRWIRGGAAIAPLAIGAYSVWKRSGPPSDPGA